MKNKNLLEEEIKNFYKLNALLRDITNVKEIRKEDILKSQAITSGFMIKSQKNGGEVEPKKCTNAAIPTFT